MLISHVLQSMPIHILSVCDVPAGVTAQIHRLFTKFFWRILLGILLDIGLHGIHCAIHMMKEV